MAATLREHLYDRNIRALVEQLKRECEKNEIPLVLCCDLSSPPSMKDYFITAATSQRGLPEKFKAALEILIGDAGYKR